MLPTLDWDPYTGRLAPIEEVEVRARVSGYLESHHFEEGQLVERGQLLFVIDTRPFEAELSKVNAEHQEAIARRNQAISQIAVAEAAKEQALARIDLARAQLERARPLVGSGAVTEDEFDELDSAMRQSVADGFSADAQIEAAKAAVSAAEAEIATTEAQMAAAELDLQYCRIEAPISGRISRRMVTEGNLVSGGSVGATQLTTIVSMDPVHAYFDASEHAMLKYLRLDAANKRQSSREVKTPVYMALADEEGYPHHGYIDFVDNRIDRATGSIRGRAIFSNPDGILVPGVFVKVMVPGSGAEERVHLPDTAVSTDQNSKFVYVVGEGNKLERRTVSTGELSKGLRVISSGLEGTEQVVTRGLQRCRPGAEVSPTVEELTPGSGNGLPDSYKPVPPNEWLQPAMAAPQPSQIGGSVRQ